MPKGLSLLNVDRTAFLRALGQSSYAYNLKRLDMLRILSDKDLDSSGTISLEEWVEALVQIRHFAAIGKTDPARHSARFCSCKAF